VIVKGVIDEDFVNYKVPSMSVVCPYCTFKCDKECGMSVCQNSSLAKADVIDVSIDNLMKRYLRNPITKAIVFNGLEPFDSFEDVFKFIERIREFRKDDIVIYTGYNENEVADYVNRLKNFGNIIIKFGRFVPNNQSHFDDVLGVYLASDNQYAKKIGTA
jgi:uncharacterized radical SAM superfamily protein